MKNKTKKTVLQLGLIIIAVTGAFASNLSRQNSTISTDQKGYFRIVGQCMKTSITCSTIQTPQCTNGASILYQLNGTSCLVQLFHKYN